MSFEEQAYTKQKESSGKFASIAWIVVGVYLFVVTERASFLTWQAVVYFLVGMFFAAIVFGIVSYLAQRLVAKILMVFSQHRTASAAAIAVVMGFVLLVGELILIYFAAEHVVTEILFPATG